MRIIIRIYLMQNPIFVERLLTISLLQTILVRLAHTFHNFEIGYGAWKMLTESNYNTVRSNCSLRFKSIKLAFSTNIILSFLHVATWTISFLKIYICSLQRTRKCLSCVLWLRSPDMLYTLSAFFIKIV